MFATLLILTANRSLPVRLDENWLELYEIAGDKMGLTEMLSRMRGPSLFKAVLLLRANLYSDLLSLFTDHDFSCGQPAHY